MNMKQNKLKSIFTRYQVIKYHFTCHSFWINVYPLLTHPFINQSMLGIIRIIAISSIFIATYYLSAELITILFSKATFSSYINHTVIELLQPMNVFIDSQETNISPLYFSMKAAFLLQGCLFIFIYLIGVNYITAHLRISGVIFSLFFSCGAILIFGSHGGKYTLGGLQNLGAGLTYLCGNLVMMISSLSMKDKIKSYSLWGGLIGSISIMISLFIETSYLPLLERLSIYFTVIWEILVGFIILNKLNKKCS